MPTPDLSLSQFGYLPLIIYTVVVLIMIGAMLGLSFVLGQRHNERATNEPFESGMLLTGGARIRFSAKFYLIGMFFVIFDLESIFLLAWAPSVRELGMGAFIQVLIFIAILVATLIYLWRSGGLDIGPQLRKPGSTGLYNQPIFGPGQQHKGEK